ncbi:hypothetical protein [Nocardia asiatica]|uniref:WXG100 family type VII secretion target n=1 Tax=Nocardia asiatica TaxID=209252 RepID=UPI003EE0EF43
MAQSLRVDTDLLRALTPELAAIADTAQQELARLKDRLATEGECWGKDEPGRVFGDSYEPAAEKGITGFENLVHNLRGMSSSVADAGDALQDQDQNIGFQLRDQDPFGSDPVVGPSFDQPLWQNPEPLRPVSPSDVAGPDSAPSTTAPGRTSAPDTAQPADQRGHQPGGNPVLPNQPNVGDYLPNDNSYLPEQQPSLGSNPTPSVPDRPAPVARNAEPPARTPTSPSATPPAATPAANPPAAQATPKSSAPDNSAARRPPESRFSRPPAGSPWMRNAPGTPWSRGGPGGSPSQVFPPGRRGPQPGAGNPKKPGKDAKQRKPKPVTRAAKRSRVRTDPDAMAAVEALAARRKLRMAGFGTSGVAKLTVDDIAAAVDGILGKYPFIRLAGIEITDLRDGGVSRVEWDREIDSEEAPVTGGWILLDRVAAANPALLAEKIAVATRSGRRVAGSDERPMYSTIVRDLGRILEADSGPRVRQSAHRSLIMEYRRISGPWDRGDSLAEVVRGFREWRAHLIRACFADGVLDPVAAVVEAFTEVELRGESACGPAKVLHRLVVEHARGRSSA